MEWLDDNLKEIQHQMQQACQKAGRDISEITLIGVSKTIDPEIINASLKIGIENLGESKPQEILRKFPLIDRPAKWHMIGNLQGNKVKMIIDKVDMIQSVDSLKLAQEIGKRASAIDIVMPVLVQVNIGDEGQKNGISIDQLFEQVQAISEVPGVQVEGLMCIAPYFEDPEDVRPYFKKMKSLFEQLKEIAYNNMTMKYLSMGMTHDFKIAIEEGATIIRVGTGLYGKRNYQGG